MSVKLKQNQGLLGKKLMILQYLLGYYPEFEKTTVLDVHNQHCFFFTLIMSIDFIILLNRVGNFIFQIQKNTGALLVLEHIF